MHDSSRNERRFNNRKEPSEMNLIIGSCDNKIVSYKAGENSQNGAISNQKGTSMTTCNSSTCKKNCQELTRNYTFPEPIIDDQPV